MIEGVEMRHKVNPYMSFHIEYKGGEPLELGRNRRLGDNIVFGFYGFDGPGPAAASLIVPRPQYT